MTPEQIASAGPLLSERGILLNARRAVLDAEFPDNRWMVEGYRFVLDRADVERLLRDLIARNEAQLAALGVEL